MFVKFCITDNEQTAVLLDISNPVTQSSDDIAFNFNTLPQHNVDTLPRKSSEDVDTELDEIISLVKEDISHDKEIIESCGKLPPVIVRDLLEEDKVLYAQHVQHGIDQDNVHMVDPASHQQFEISSIPLVQCEDALENINVSGEFSSIPIEQCEASTQSESQPIASSEQCEASVVQITENGEASSFTVQLKSTAPWGNTLGVIDENVPLENRENIMRSVEEQLSVRKKPDCSTRVL